MVTKLQLFEIMLNIVARSLPLHVLGQLTPGNDKHADVTSSAGPRY